MDWDELKHLAKDPMFQGAVLGITIQSVILGVTLITYQKFGPNLKINLPPKEAQLLLEGEPVFFASKLGTLVLTKFPI